LERAGTINYAGKTITLGKFRKKNKNSKKTCRFPERTDPNRRWINFLDGRLFRILLSLGARLDRMAASCAQRYSSQWKNYWKNAK